MKNCFTSLKTKSEMAVNAVSKSDFTVKILDAKCDPAACNDRFGNALYRVKANIYYKGNLIDSFSGFCPYGKYNYNELDENGEVTRPMLTLAEIKAQLDERLNRSLANGLTLDDIFREPLLDCYIDWVLWIIYEEMAYSIPSNKMVWAFEQLYCLKSKENGQFHLIISDDKNELTGLSCYPTITSKAHNKNKVKTDADHKLFISNWDQKPRLF